MTDALQLRDNAKYQLEQIKDLESGMEYLNKMKAIEVWVKAEKKDAELQNLIAEQKLRTQRILGRLLANADLSTGAVVVGGDRAKLKEYGISKDQSSAFQAIADIPDEPFEDFIKEKKEAVNKAVSELTTTGAVRLSKTLKEKQQDKATVANIETRLMMERDLRNLAIELRKKYKPHEIELLIKFLTK